MISILQNHWQSLCRYAGGLILFGSAVMALSLVSPAFNHGLNVLLVQFIWKGIATNSSVWQAIGVVVAIAMFMAGVGFTTERDYKIGIPMLLADVILIIFLVGVMN